MISFITTHYNRLFLRKQNSILSAAAVIMITVFASRVLGLVRERLLAAQFSTPELDIYFAAFRLPNLIFELLIMGALSTAFIPVFTRYIVKNSKDEAFNMASSVINLTVIALVILAVPLYVFAWQISFFIVPGFSEAERTLMVSFTRIMLVGQLIPLVIGNYLTGMLQSFQRFILPSLAPVIYNVGIIIGIVFLSPFYGLYGAVWGVVIGAILFLLIQLPLVLGFGFKIRPTLNTSHPAVREVGKLVMPRMFGLAVSQIDTTVDLMLASILTRGSITIFHFAQHLQQFPVSLFGATFAQAALPTFSAAAANHDRQTFKKFLLASMHQTLFFVLPLSVMLIVLRIPIVRLVFGADRFDWNATVLTGRTLSFFAISIFAQSLVQLFARAFYALYDTKTPVMVGIISVLTNTFLSIAFVQVWQLPVWALAISTSVANILNVSLLFILLYRKLNGFNFGDLVIPPVKMVVATLITGICMYVPIKLLDQLVFDTTQVFELMLLTGVAIGSGLSVYIFLAWLFDIAEVTTFFTLLQKMKKVPRFFFSQSPDLVNTDPPSVS